MEIRPELLAFFDHLCAKPKKCCAVCFQDFKKECPEGSNHRIWVSSVTFKHPVYKSRKFKLCGDCYGDWLQDQKRAEKRNQSRKV